MFRGAGRIGDQRPHYIGTSASITPVTVRLHSTLDITDNWRPTCMLGTS